MKVKLLFRPGSLWIGAHWSPQLRQWCINLLPCVTLRIRLAPNITSHQNYQRIQELDRRICRTLAKLGSRISTESLDLVQDIIEAMGEIRRIERSAQDGRTS